MTLPVPHLKQECPHTCVVACIRMVLAYLGQEHTEEELAEVCAALEDPSTGPFGEAQDRLRAGAGVEDESCRLARTPFEEGLRQMIEGYRSLLPPFAKAQDSQREAGTCSRG